MTAKTIRNIHSILWCLRDGEALEIDSMEPCSVCSPTGCYATPAVRHYTSRTIAKVIEEDHQAHPVLALLFSLVTITGVRRGELCALQVHDVDLVDGAAAI